jgi:hypothetical protein
MKGDAMRTRLILSLALLAFVAAQTGAIAQEVLPRPEQPFGGFISRKAKDSVKDCQNPAKLGVMRNGILLHHGKNLKADVFPVCELIKIRFGVS